MIEGPRAATSAELPAVVGLSNAVFSPDGHSDMGRAFPTVFCDRNLVNLRVCLDDGKPVSLVAMAVREVELGGARVRAACVGSVCTLAEYRGQGLAARLLEDAISRALSQGAVIVLISGWRGLYRRAGCIDAGLFRTVKVDRRSRLPRVRCDVRGWTPADVGAMAGLQRAERVRHLRSEEETRTLLETGMVFARHGRSWVVSVEGRIAAWLSAADPDRSSGGTALAVREIAGSRLALLAGMPAVLRAAALPRAEIDAVASDIEMEILAKAFGLDAEPRGFHGTMKIIDAPGLFRSLQGWLAERLNASEAHGLRIETEGRVVFSYEDQRLVVEGPEDLAALVFGSVERPLPSPPAGPLAEILRRLFPVPLPCYGLSYI